MGVNHAVRRDGVSTGIEHVLFDLRDGLSQTAEGLIECAESAITRVQHAQGRDSVPQMRDPRGKRFGRFGFFDMP